MTDFPDVSRSGIDGLINWLNEQRRTNAAASLVGLLGGHVIDRNSLLDLACIDLMHQHRNGYLVRAEQYSRDFPQLNRASDLLDLIDAELCVAAEMRQPIDLNSYFDRFPELASDIEELAQLDVVTEVPCFHRQPEHGESDPAQTRRFEARSQAFDPLNVESSGFSIDPVKLRDADVSSADRKALIARLNEEYPMMIPDWFLVDQCIRRGKDSCLLRGRDDVRGMPVAMKIVRIPSRMADQEVIDLLDVCEAASRVQNRHWIAPQMAAVQMGCLGVIRPWLFANAWEPNFLSSSFGNADSAEDITQTLHGNARHHASHNDAGSPMKIILRRLKQLATVAFAVESAHRSGATHGAIHAGNLAIDHQENVCIFDATSTLIALQRWFDNKSTAMQSLDQRIHSDVEDMVNLVHDTANWIPTPAAEQLVKQVRSCVSDRGQSPLTRIGEILLQYADDYQPSDYQPSIRNSRVNADVRWRTRLARWLS